MNITDLPEGTDNVHTDMLVAPCCEVCHCTIDRSDQRYYVNVGGAPKGEWPAMHYDCAEYEYVVPGRRSN